MAISVIKNTDCSINFKISEDISSRKTVDLAGYKNFIFGLSENNRLVIRKEFAKNEIQVWSNLDILQPYIIRVLFKKTNFENIIPNNSDEEKIRTYELFGIKNDGTTVRFCFGDFYLEESPCMSK